MSDAGQLAQASLAAGVETALYAPAVNVKASLFVNFANRGVAAVRVRVIHRPGAAATVDADFLAFDELIPGNESRSSRVFEVKNPQEVRVQSDTATVTAQANGLERPA